MSRRKKRGSLQLSINAIVILVMAMVVLGVGLTFIRSLFDQGSGQLGRAINNADLENPASPEKLLTVDRSVTIKSGGDSRLHVGFYNSQNSCVAATPSYLAGNPISLAGSTTIKCQGATGEVDLLLSSPMINVQPGTATGFEVAISDIGSALSGSYVCGFQMFVQELPNCNLNNPGPQITSTPSGQFFLEVTN